MKPNWKNIHRDFTKELVKEWQAQGFNFHQTADWINIYSTHDRVWAINQPYYHAWLRNIKHKDSEWVLNYGDNKALKAEYKLYQINYLINLNTPHNNPNKKPFSTTKLLMIGSLTLLTIYLLTKHYDS